MIGVIATVLGNIATGVVLWGISGAVLFFVLSRLPRHIENIDKTESELYFVAVIPALNEGRVIAATVRHLLSRPWLAVVVVNDGSDDDTAAELESVDDPRLYVLTRKLPNARLGKGAALNAAYQQILHSSQLARGIDPSQVVLAVIDADGRLDDDALEHAAKTFADPGVGACQLAVKIRNREDSFWTRMQHFEFIAFTHLYQRGREWTGSVGLGGNGQFVRASALRDLGEAPWSSCLTEDMDLGIRLLLKGWRSRFVSNVYVSQQAVAQFRRLVRQRIRWFQGTLQCLRHLPAVLASPNLQLSARIDLVTILLTPIVMLALSPFMLIGSATIVAAIAAVFSHDLDASALMPVYALGFLVPIMLGYVFWRHDRDATVVDALITGHQFALYGFLWPIVGWGALLRQVRRHKSWDRTLREAEGHALLVAGGSAR